MREIKVRGYAKEEMLGSQWMYGTGIHKTVFTDEYADRTGVKEEWFIFTESGWVQVNPSSVGEYTGLKDKNGIDIFEGDVLHINKYFNGVDIYGKVYWKGAGFALITRRGSDTGQGYFEIVTPFTEIIGNTFENPCLLEGEENAKSSE